MAEFEFELGVKITRLETVAEALMVVERMVVLTVTVTVAAAAAGAHVGSADIVGSSQGLPLT